MAAPLSAATFCDRHGTPSSARKVPRPKGGPAQRGKFRRTSANPAQRCFSAPKRTQTQRDNARGRMATQLSTATLGARQTPQLRAASSAGEEQHTSMRGYSGPE